MKKLIAPAVLAVALGVAGSAAAEGNFSVGYAQLGTDSLGADVDLGAIRGTIGWQLNSVFGLEAEAALGVKDEKVGGATLKLENEFAGYVTARAPIADRFSLHARLGYGSTKLKASNGATSVSESESSWNAGVGATFNITESTGLRFDYTRYTYDGADGDAFAIALSRSF